MTYDEAAKKYEMARKVTSAAFAEYNARQGEFDAIQECAREEMKAKEEMERIAELTSEKPTWASRKTTPARTVGQKEQKS